MLAAAVALSGWASAARAELEVVSNNAAAFWPNNPDQAAVRVSTWQPSGGTRGVRGDRIQAQTFQVEEAFELDRIFLAYQWVGDTNQGSLETNFTKIRIVEVEDVFSSTGYTAGAVVAPQISFTILADPDPGDSVENPPNFYALELAWNSTVDGPLLLTPRTGSQGYALEINGTHIGQGGSAIALIQRFLAVDPETNPGGGSYPLGRAYEMVGVSENNWGGGGHDIVMGITAVPYAPGDFDHDGDVDGDDLATWKTNFGSEDVDSWTGDADGDGDADGNDFLLWQRNVTSPPVEAAAVPEPATAGLAVCGLAAAAFARRRRANRRGQ